MANRDSQLITAAMWGSKNDVDRLMLEGKDVTTYGKNNQTILHYAAQYGWLDIVRKVVQMGKLSIDSKSKSGQSPILLAAKSKYREIVDFFLKMGADVTACDRDGWTLLHSASMWGWLGVVQHIVKTNKVNVNLETKKGDSPLLLASRSDSGELVEFLLKNGSDVNVWYRNGWTLLHQASDKGWLKVVQHILKTGRFDINLKTKLGDTPLLLAARPRGKEVVDFLLKMGSNLTDTESRGWTILHFASFHGWLDVVQFISNKEKTIVNLPTKDNSNPLLFAADQDKIDVINFLLQLGADHWCPISKKQFNKMSKHKTLAKILAKDVNFCTFATIHIFNDRLLPALYTMLDGTEELPSIDMLRVPHRSNESDLIREFVANEIRTNGKCNAMDFHPPVLKLMCVKSILSQCSLKRQTPFDFESSGSKCKKKNLNGSRY